MDLTSEHELSVDRRLGHWKSQLIDLSLRNRLLNFQSAHPVTIRFIQPGPQEVFDHIVKRGKELIVLQPGLGVKQDRIIGDEEAIILGKGEALPDISAEALTRALVRLKVKARSAMREQGFNILFLSFGLLHWKDAEGEELRSPLILVPVELKRDTCFDPYRLIALDDVSINPTLIRKLQMDYNVALPSLPDNLATLNLAAFYEDMKKVSNSSDSWSVDDEVHLSLFSFTKSGMYNDLEFAADIAYSHPVIKALVGDHSGLSEGSADDVALDEIPSSKSYQILDADSSQRQAIEAAKRGESFVLQGPPGTGKSQTISNIIAEMIAAGRTVLFVSEKMAALEVVKCRLDECHIGDYCLELHSHKASKSAVLAELSKALEPCKDKAVSERELQRLDSLRAGLNEYATALHRPRGRTSWTAFEVHGHLSNLRDVEDLSFEIPAVLDMDGEQFDHLNSLVQRVADEYPRLQNMDANPWSKSIISSWDFGTKAEVSKRLQSFKESLDSCISQLREASSECDVDEPKNMHEAHLVLEFLRTISETPFPLEDWLDTKKIDGLILKAEEARVAHAEYQHSMDWLLSRYSKEVMELDSHSMMDRMNRRQDSMLRFLDRGFKRDRNALLKLRVHPAKMRFDEIQFDLNEINQIKETGLRLRESDREFMRLFGGFFRGETTDWSALSKSLEWTRRFLQGYEPAENAKLCRVICHDKKTVEKLKSKMLEMTNALGLLELKVRSLSEYFAIRSMPQNGATIKEIDFDELLTWAEGLMGKLDLLHEWIELRGLLAECERSGLQNLLEETKRAQISSSNLQRVFLKQLYVQWLDAVYSSDPILKSFSSEQQAGMIREFRRLDKGQFELASRRISQLMNDRRKDAWDPTSNDKKSEGYILRREIAKKRGQKTVHQLFAEIPRLLLTLKPCLLMTPLSVSQFLDPKFFKFNLVIFDEASQIRPEDAVGAIMRGQQIIVVGDAKQLPPTSFFSIVDDEREGVEELDSILDECSTIGIPQRALLWHYRSRHESLIAFSNFHFYGNRLNTFPAARDEAEGTGIEFIYVPDGIYDRGKTRKNLREAIKTAQLVFQHFVEYPERSLGVVAFSEAQQMAILEELEKLRRSRPEYEAYFDENRTEEFFVKTLESVQGDERDVMFFSVGYGRDEQGEISLNFGPLNSLGGQRRLNVAITRARVGIKLISSMQPEDLGISKSPSQGVRLLREYMEFTKSGGQRDVLFPDASDDVGIMEETLCQALRARGLEVHRNLGCSGYRIDIAVTDSSIPGRYLLGIECDGGMYRSAGTARDRERLRQETLEKLGWRVHRLWSRDWVEKPERELEIIMNLIEEEKRAVWSEMSSAQAIFSSNNESVMEGESEEIASMAEVVPLEVTQATDDSPLPNTFLPIYYKKVGREDLVDLAKKHSTNPTAVEREVIARVVSIEGPIHRVAMMKRLCDFYGQLRKGRSKDHGPTTAISRGRAAIEDASRRGLISIKEEFLWPMDMEVPPVRCNPPDSPFRDIAEIAPEEVEQAVLMSVGPTGRTVESLISRSAKMLGLDPESERVRSRISATIITFIDLRKLEYGERMVSLVDRSYRNSNVS